MFHVEQSEGAGGVQRLFRPSLSRCYAVEHFPAGELGKVGVQEAGCHDDFGLRFGFDPGQFFYRLEQGWVKRKLLHGLFKLFGIADRHSSLQFRG